MSEQKQINPCAEQHYQVHSSDLPLSCPTADMGVWNAHPRVYLDIQSKGKATCPYCGATYTLISD